MTPVSDKPRVLVVGAGAVGQVYARHAQLGGADVTFFVRKKYRAEVSRGFDMYPLNRRGTQPVRFEGFSVVSRAGEVAGKSFDQIYLTVSSPALRGPWLPEFAAVTGNATIIALQPGLDDLETIVAAGIPKERIVSGVITLISYHAPLPGETRFPRPGMAYWFPPLAPSPLCGEPARRDAAVGLLRAGHLPAKRHPNVPQLAAFPTAIMMPYLVALESAGWSLKALTSDVMELGARGAREALAIVALTWGKPPLQIRMIARPRMLRFGLYLARRVVPLPLEVYLKEHFTKVGDQTRMLMAGYIKRGKQAGLDVTGLEQLMAATAASPSRAQATAG
jgi:2-dehydropantoate 2-reductase